MGHSLKDKKHAQSTNPPHYFTDQRFYAFTSLQNKAKRPPYHHPAPLYQHWSVNNLIARLSVSPADYFIRLSHTSTNGVSSNTPSKL
ncbi:hypothetical protein NPX99_05235 [Bartonella sp. 220]|uniref:hypothetical protein n=1 Tax=Bartonella sp. 220B TaxID=2967260 RepID=UPI0022A90665|nr:hypothetical protein [Bartonella sp. 220B]MCZ2158679.1 hypothetical protein [Bartonella sp. 220B]